jgi:hypothetical protein
MDLKIWTFRVSKGLCWLGLRSVADAYEQSTEVVGFIQRGHSRLADAPSCRKSLLLQLSLQSAGVTSVHKQTADGAHRPYQGLLNFTPYPVGQHADRRTLNDASNKSIAPLRPLSRNSSLVNRMMGGSVVSNCTKTG